jgi:hypothetical protein
MTCPISLGAIILLSLVIFYTASNLVVLVAAFILLSILFNLGRNENFIPFSSGLAENPVDTGMERPLFGPLYPVTSKVTRERQYRTMHGLPWCESPLGDTEVGESICEGRMGPTMTSLPYEMDKI